MTSRALLLFLPGVLVLGLTGPARADLNEDGRAAYLRGDYVNAERLFSQALRQAPGDPLLHYHRGVALMQLARWRDAAAAFEAALRASPPPELAAAAQEGLRSLLPMLEIPAGRAQNADESTVRLQRIGGNWIAEVRLNDSRTARFLVDTGAAVCVVAPELAAALGIRPPRDGQTIPLQTISGRTSGPLVRIPLLRVGDAEAEDVVAVVHPPGPSMDGILGNTFLSRFTVTLDPERGVLHLRSR